MQDGRVIKLVVSVTCYNEDGDELQRSLEGIAANLSSLQALGYSWKEIAVVVIIDGEEKANPSLLEYAEQKLKVFDGSLMTSKRKDGKPVTMHFFESSCQLSEYKLSNSYYPPLQVIFALKARNGGKLNSHLWLLSAVVPQLNPKYVIMIDVGTRPADTAIAALIREMELDPKIGACAGEITVRNLKYFNVLQSAQAFEYKLSHILSKAAESVWGYVSVLPGAFSAYRWEAIRGAPLKRYFTTEETSIALLGPFWGNASLAEDRLLCAEILAKKGCDWKLTWIKGARAETDTPMALPELIRQRRRWLNGALFVQVLFLAEFSRFLYGTTHPLWRKALLCMQFVINAMDTTLTWFTSGMFFLSLLIIYQGVLDRMAGVERTDIGQRTFDSSLALFGFGFLYCSVFLLLVLTSLVGNVGNLRTFYFSVTLYYALVMALSVCGTAWLLWGYVEFDLALTLTVALSTGAYILTPLLHGELKTALMTVVQFFLTLPIYVNMFMVHSIANLHDISWGTKSGGLISEQRRALQAEAKREAKRAERAQQVIQDVIVGAHEADVSPLAAGMQRADSGAAPQAEGASAHAVDSHHEEDAVAAAVREDTRPHAITTSSSRQGSNDSNVSVPEDRIDQGIEQFGVEGDSDMSDEAPPALEVAPTAHLGVTPGRWPSSTRSAKVARASGAPPRAPAATTGGRAGSKKSFGWGSDVDDAPRPKTAGTLPATQDDSESDQGPGRTAGRPLHSTTSRRGRATRHAGASPESSVPVDDIDTVLQHGMDAHKRTKSSKDLLESGQVMVHGPKQRMNTASSAKLQSLVRQLGIPADSVENAAGRGLSGAVLNAEEYDEMIGDDSGSSPRDLTQPNHASLGRASASQVQFASSQVLQVADDGEDLDMPELTGDADEGDEGLPNLDDTQADIELIQEAVRIAEAHQAAAQRAKDRAKNMAMDKDRLKEEFNVFRLRVLAAWLISNALFVGVVVYYSWISQFSIVLAVVITYAAGIRLFGTVIFQLHRLARNVFRRACCCCYRRDVFTGKPRCCCRKRNYYRHDHKWMQQVGLLQPLGRGGPSEDSTYGSGSGSDSDSDSEITAVKLVNSVGARSGRSADPVIAQSVGATPVAMLQYNASYGATPLVSGLGAASPAVSIKSDVGALEQRAAQRGVSGGGSQTSQRFSALGLAQPGQLLTAASPANPGAAALAAQPLSETPARQSSVKTAVTASMAIAAMRARAGASRSTLPNAPEGATAVPLFAVDYDEFQDQDSLSSSSMSTDYSVASSIGSATSSRHRRGRHRRRTRGAGWQAFDPVRFSSREQVALPGGLGSPESGPAQTAGAPPLLAGVPASGSNGPAQTAVSNAWPSKAGILAEAARQAMQNAPLVRRSSSSILTSPATGGGHEVGFATTPSLSVSRRGVGGFVPSGGRGSASGVPKDPNAAPVAARGSPNQSARIRLLKVVQSRGTTASRAAYRNMYGEATVGETLQRSPAHAQQRRDDDIPEETTVEE